METHRYEHQEAGLSIRERVMADMPMWVKVLHEYMNKLDQEYNRTGRISFDNDR